MMGFSGASEVNKMFLRSRGMSTSPLCLYFVALESHWVYLELIGSSGESLCCLFEMPTLQVRKPWWFQETGILLSIFTA